MSLSVRVLASRASGSRASRRKYGDFTRAASTKLARWRSVSASSISGGSHGSQSSWALVNTTGTVWSGGTRTLSGMSGPRGSGAAGQGAQSGHHSNLEGQEGGDLGEGHDVGRGPARVQQRLERARVGVARMQDEQVQVLEGRGKTRTQRAAGCLAHSIDRPGRIFATQRTGRVAAVGAVRPGFRDGCVNRLAQRHRGLAGGETRGIESRGRLLAVQAGDEAGYREALLSRDVARDLRREQRAVARLRVGARLGPAGAN